MAKTNADRFIGRWREAEHGTRWPKVLIEMGLSPVNLNDWRKERPGFEELFQEVLSHHQTPLGTQRLSELEARREFFLECLVECSKDPSKGTKSLRRRAAEMAGVELGTVAAYLRPSSPRYSAEFHERFERQMGTITALAADRADFLATTSADDVKESGDDFRVMTPLLKYLEKTDHRYRDQRHLTVDAHHHHSGTVKHVQELKQVMVGVKERFLSLPEGLEALDVDFVQVEEKERVEA